MRIETWLESLTQQRAIAVIRSESFAIGENMAKAVAAGGMRLIEITWNSEQSAALIAHLRATLPDCLIGTGTILSVGQMKEAIAVGAQFLFTPHVEPVLIQLAREHDLPIVPGALSPTEIVQAWQAGAPTVKVFPAQAMGGAEYIRSLQGPLGQIPLIPTGGVTVENAPEFLRAGAIAVGLAGSLFSPKVVQQQDWNAITQQAQTLVARLTQNSPASICRKS
ncbi:MAG TPA: bifunctional 4-hydroxy-2-oxoglutarate aldolase/2-dehydro-3-deoxy-phosphogluconate aldolase [Thermosynechococcaceae cyanobacterium]